MCSWDLLIVLTKLASCPELVQEVSPASCAHCFSCDNHSLAGCPFFHHSFLSLVQAANTMLEGRRKNVKRSYQAPKAHSLKQLL